MRRLPILKDPNLLVGANTADDAGVYRIDRDRALVQTVDFFTPIVDDPFTYGEIAAANALSDVYAMGGRPLTALNIVGMPADIVPPAVIAEILHGGASKAKEARCALVGGHSIRNPEPIYGMAITGIVSPKKLLTNAAARPGDLLVLTKPLGTGIITTGIKRGIVSPATAKKAIQSMRKLNVVGAAIAERGLSKAAVDITGFGLLGHLGSMCHASKVGAELEAAKVPVISSEVWTLIGEDCIPGGTRQNLKTAESFTEWSGVTEARKYLLADAQTSGGLLLCVKPAHLKAVIKLLGRPAIIGRIVASRRPRICVAA